MGRRRSRAMIPEARQGMEQLKWQVMREQGYVAGNVQPERVIYEVAERLGVPLAPGYNGQLSTEEAGKVGGHIGGPMVRELIRRAQETLANQRRP